MALIGSMQKGKSRMFRLLVSLILLLSPTVCADQKAELRRADIEKILGKPIAEQENSAVYRMSEPGSVFINVEFTKRDIVTRLVMEGACSTGEAFHKKLESIVSHEIRGKYLKRKLVGEIGDCSNGYQDEYENVLISYSQSNCMNCYQQQFVVEWRKAERKNGPPSNNSFNASGNKRDFHSHGLNDWFYSSRRVNSGVRL